MDLTWHVRRFAELTGAEVYAILALRQRVFVVEQKCCYLDADGYDQPSTHLWAQRGDAIVAYLRIVPAGLKFAGLSPDGLLPETVEYADHPWFIGVQFHPELKSRPFDPHPLFKGFIAAAVEQSRLV